MLRELLPEQTAQFLTSEWSEDLLPILNKYHFGLDIAYKALNADNLKLLHENGVTVNCWTVNDPEDARKLIEWGIDQITSNILE